MAEGQVSIEGETHRLPRPFWVIATQNPVEHHGTYPLPEAQLDRFTVELSIGYPAKEQELEILTALAAPPALESLEAIATVDEARLEQERVRKLPVDEDVCRYIIDLVDATRQEPQLQLGVSPRGGIALYRMAQAWAHVEGRDAALPDDVKAVAVRTLAHRLVLDTKAKYSGVSKQDVVRALLEQVPVPV
jgi:MoxR-like ATPase